jgi:hypothetical protein
VALGRRCDVGCASWPDDQKYRTCPICGESTSRFTNLAPLDEDEAVSLIFEHFYEGWCDAKNQPTTGGLPMSPEDSLYWEGKYPGGTSADERG